MSVLYHYCSTETFFAIVSSKKILLSSMSLSNDSMEGRLVSTTFNDFLKESNIDDKTQETVKAALNVAEGALDGLAFCLSSKPDLLSQWRGYADDGHGFSLGFSKKYLELLTKKGNESGAIFGLYKVIYNEEGQRKILRPIYEDIKKLVDTGCLNENSYVVLGGTSDELLNKRNEYSKALNKLWDVTQPVLSLIYTLKNKAFSEEAEWRLLSSFSRFSGNAKYRTMRDRLVPYREVKFLDLGRKIVTDVYLGPKNITPIHVVKAFLDEFGFKGVKIHKSSATYR